MKKKALSCLALLLCLTLAACGEKETQESKAPEKTVVTGEAEGYGGTIKAEVTLSDGKIVDLKLTGEGETPAIGGAALEPLKEAILAAGTVEGVDSIAGATWTSKGVFSAVRKAMGMEETPVESGPPELSATGLSHGLGVAATGRTGHGYSFNQVVAYVLFDATGRILDLEIDQLEVANPSHFTGFPGQTVDEEGTAQDEDTFLAQVAAWTTKRERGENYQMTSGTWNDEIDIYEKGFIGMTVDEIEGWFASSFGTDGKPLNPSSDGWDELTDDQKAKLDTIAGATMSLRDGHGDILAAVRKAYENRRGVEAGSVSKLGLGINSTGRSGPGSDDQGVGVYSFNITMVGACYDADGKVVAMYSDIMEVATPNYDGEYMPDFTGFPGQSYNADENHDEKVDTVWTQDEDTFLDQVAAWRTKRERGDTYKLGSGSWADEMDIFEASFVGKTTQEIDAWYERGFSDRNGRPLSASSTNDEDLAKWNRLTDAQKAEMDTLAGATMSLSDAHGNILGSIDRAWANAKDTAITIGK